MVIKLVTVYLPLNFLTANILRHLMNLLRRIGFGFAVWSCARKTETHMKFLFHNKSN